MNTKMMKGKRLRKDHVCLGTDIMASCRGAWKPASAFSRPTRLVPPTAIFLFCSMQEYHKQEWQDSGANVDVGHSFPEVPPSFVDLMTGGPIQSNTLHGIPLSTRWPLLSPSLFPPSIGTRS